MGRVPNALRGWIRTLDDIERSSVDPVKGLIKVRQCEVLLFFAQHPVWTNVTFGDAVAEKRVSVFDVEARSATAFQHSGAIRVPCIIILGTINTRAVVLQRHRHRPQECRLEDFVFGDDSVVKRR